MNRSTYSPFQGGPIKKIVKVVCLIAFAYAVLMAIALGRKDGVTVAVGGIALVILVVMTLVESFRYWNDLKK